MEKADKRASDADRGLTLLTVKEVAELLRTTPAAIYAAVERGQLPGIIRLGRRLLFRRERLVEWLAEKEADSPNREERR